MLGDANRQIDEILRLVPTGFPTFAFVDPWGAQVRWETVTKLASHRAASGRKIEILMLFGYNHGLVRLLPRDPTRMEHEHVLDEVMPDPQIWRRIYRARIEQQAGPFEMRRNMLTAYVVGLRALGYRHVPAPLLVTTPNGRSLYFLVFASDHPAGERIMTWCLSNVLHTQIQMSFLDYSEWY